MKLFKNITIYVIAFLGIFTFTLSASEGASSGLPQFNPAFYSQQIFWLVINFVIIYLFLMYIVMPKINKIKVARNYKTVGQLEKAIAIKKEIQILQEEQNKEDAIIRSKCDNINNNLNEKIKILNDNKFNELEAIKLDKQSKFNDKIALLKISANEEIENSSKQITAAILVKLELDKIINIKG